MNKLITILILFFCMPFFSYSDFTADLSQFTLNQATGTYSCSVVGTGDASNASSSSGTFSIVSLEGNVAHVFMQGQSRSTPYQIITITGNMLVNHSTKTVAGTAIESVWKKNRNDKNPKKYTSVASGSFTAADFSDLSLSATGTLVP